MRTRITRSAWSVRVALSVLLLAALAGCATANQPNTTNATSASKTLVVARDMDLSTLDPAYAYCDTCQIYLSAAYQTLIGLAPNNKTLVPDLASSWSSNANGTVYTFQLNPKAKFSDGTPVTSADVKFSWLRLKYIAGGASYLVQDIKSINDSNPETVVVTLSAPNSEFLNEVNATYMGITNSKVAIAHGATDAPNAATADHAQHWFQTHSAGSGPYVLQSYTPGSSLNLVANPNYWGPDPGPYYTTVIMKQTVNAITQGQMLTTGAADISMEIDPITAKNVSGPVTLKRVPSYNFIYLGLIPGATSNTSVPLDPKIRQAIRDAIDYKGLIQTLLAGDGALQASPIPNGFDGSAGLPLPQTNLTQAKALLAQDGHPHGFTVTATYLALNVYGIDFNTAMQYIAQDLAKVNITMKLQPVASGSVFQGDIAKGNVPITMIYFAPDYLGSAQYLNYFGLVKGSTWAGIAAGPAGRAPLINSGENTTFAKALAATSASTRTQLYHQLGQDMINDGIIIPLFSPDLILAYRNSVHGVFYSACCNLELWKLTGK